MRPPRSSMLLVVLLLGFETAAARKHRRGRHLEQGAACGDGSGICAANLACNCVDEVVARRLFGAPAAGGSRSIKERVCTCQHAPPSTPPPPSPVSPPAPPAPSHIILGPNDPCAVNGLDALTLAQCTAVAAEHGYTLPSIHHLSNSHDPPGCFTTSSSDMFWHNANLAASPSSSSRYRVCAYSATYQAG